MDTKTETDQQAVRRLQAEVDRLKTALSNYTSCRHADLNCRCTMEARAALYPYVAAASSKGDK